MMMPPFWFVQKDPLVNQEFGNALLEDATLGVLNTRELLFAEQRLDDCAGTFDQPWPSGYPLPIAALPDYGFAPDYWTFGGYDFASRRLRDALAQSDDVLQFIPFDLLRASRAARAQKYCWMRILQAQEALDLSRCECEIEERPHAVTGRLVRSLSDVDLLTLRDDLAPRTEIFRVREYQTFVLVTDPVAARVLRAGCTGIEFADPANRFDGARVERYRTADGVAERRVGFLD